MPTKKETNPWYEAKRLLHQDYLDEFVTADMHVHSVYCLRPEYEACDFKKFKTNLKAFLKKMANDEERAQRDMEAFIYDTSIYKLAKDDPKQWHGSNAEVLLKQDVKNGLHKKRSQS